MDLSPREVVAPAPTSTKKRPWAAMVVLAVVIVAGGVFVVKFLDSAVDYYCNVDEVGVKDGCETGRNIRIQGVVESGSVSKPDANGGVAFVITFNGESMPVVVGSRPTGLFQECVPVVVRGHVVVDNGSRYFAGDEVIVKHDNKYDAANADRLAQGNEEAAACSRTG